MALPYIGMKRPAYSIESPVFCGKLCEQEMGRNSRADDSQGKDDENNTIACDVDEVDETASAQLLVRGTPLTIRTARATELYVLYDSRGMHVIQQLLQQMFVHYRMKLTIERLMTLRERKQVGTNNKMVQMVQKVQRVHLGKWSAGSECCTGSLSEKLKRKTAHPFFPVLRGCHLLDAPRPLQVSLVHRRVLFRNKTT